jgi:hypothetical protein
MSRKSYAASHVSFLQTLPERNKTLIVLEQASLIQAFRLG